MPDGALDKERLDLLRSANGLDVERTAKVRAFVAGSIPLGWAACGG
jgi:hypothetical protein